VDDLALLWSLLGIGLLSCNLFQVLILKPIMASFLGQEAYSTTLRNKYFKEGWILGVVIFLNIWALKTFSSNEWFCSMLPWFCSTKELWWEGSKLMTGGVKWFTLITIANDGFALVLTLIDKFYWRKDGITIGDVVSMGLAYLLLVYSYAKGYMRVGCAILISQNFADMFLYAYGMLALKETTKNFNTSVLQSFCMMMFVILFGWMKFANAPKIIFSILKEAPQCGEVTGWTEWIGALVLVGGMEVIYLHWVILLSMGLKRSL